MKFSPKKYIALLALGALTACEIDEQVNPNSAVLEDILANASQTDLNNLVTGSIYNMRASHDVYVTATGTIAREFYLFDADPRNLTELLGFASNGNSVPLDGNTFYTTAPWNDRYQTIKNLNILEEALVNAQPDVTEAEKDGYRALLKTLKAHEYLMLVNAQFENGIRLDVSDPDNLGPIIKDVGQIYDFILGLLDEGLADLEGAEFAFRLPSGFANFNTPETFGLFNRALAARAHLYAGDNAEALADLEDSFFDLNGELDVAVRMTFSVTGTDLTNNLFKTPDQNGDQIVVNDGFIEDAEAGDTRVTSKTGLRADPAGQGGANGLYETRLYSGASAPIDIIRNEELIFIYAEANIRTGNLAEGVTALNIIRTSAGLEPLETAKPDIIGDQEALLTEVLRQRRYSFWGEGHFIVDLRRFDELNADSEFVDVDVILIDTDGDKVPDSPAPQTVFEMFPVPVTEN